MTRRLPPVEEVVGGSHGTVAGYAQMEQLAARCRDRAGALTERSLLGPRVVADGELVTSAVFSPITCATAQVQVLDATAGPHGLTLHALGLEAEGVLVGAAVAGFRAADRFAGAVAAESAALLGRTVVRGFVPLVLLPGTGAYAASALLLHEDVRRRLGSLAHDHPGLVQHVVAAGGGLLEGVTPPGAVGWVSGLADDGGTLSPTTNDAAALLALLLGDRADVVVDEVGRDDAPTSRAPASLEDLVRDLGATADLDAEDPALRGAVRIHEVVGAGEPRYVVYLPGTDDMSPVPAGGPTARDMLTNYQLLSGRDDAYTAGVVEAMRRAGIGGHDVMVVGHSQGGMAAVSLAADPAVSAEFRISHVVTAGSPTAQVAHVPEGTSALHLENRGDAVPWLDGADNPDQPTRVTVRFDAGDSDVAGNHGLDRYVLGAAAADASGHGSVLDAVGTMRRNGFLDPDARVARVLTYTVARP